MTPATTNRCVFATAMLGIALAVMMAMQAQAAERWSWPSTSRATSERPVPTRVPWSPTSTTRTATSSPSSNTTSLKTASTSPGGRSGCPTFYSGWCGDVLPIVMYDGLRFYYEARDLADGLLDRLGEPTGRHDRADRP